MSLIQSLIRRYYWRKTRARRIVYKAVRKQEKDRTKEALAVSKDHWSIWKKYGIQEYRYVAVEKRYEFIMGSRQDKADHSFEWMLAGSPYIQHIWRELGGLKI